MGRSWEKLIDSVKTSLRFVQKNPHPSEEVLHTLLVEAEHSVNFRPLIHVSCDPRDGEAVTPNHLLLGLSSVQLPLSRHDKNSLSIKDQWKLSKYYADMFWSRWLREYLPTLHPLKVNDIVLIMENRIAHNE